MKRCILWLLSLVLFFAPILSSQACEADSVLIGDTLFFGTYPKSGGCESAEDPIEWIVLDKKDGMLLLISRTGLETGPYNVEKKRATWAESSVRAWLNASFLEEAFTGEEQCAIIETLVTTPGGSFKSPATGEKIKIAQSDDTCDLVFLLSVTEVLKYFPKENQRRASNNSYLLDKAESAMPYPAEGDPCDFQYGNWWLRDVRQDKGIKSGFHVKSYGSIASGGQINLKRYVIRPVMWVDQNLLSDNAFACD